MPSAPTRLRPDLVVCDLAGTTVHDRGEVPAAFEAALGEAGLRYDDAEVHAWRGASKREVLARLLARQDRGDGNDAERVYRNVSPFGDIQVYSSSYMHFAPGLSDNAAFNLPQVPANAYIGMYIDGDGPEGIMRDLARCATSASSPTTASPGSACS